MMYLDTDGVYRFDSGTDAQDAARAAWNAAQRIEMGSGLSVRAEFNGSPLDAYPSDHCYQLVAMRWHYERLLIQARAR